MAVTLAVIPYSTLLLKKIKSLHAARSSTSMFKGSSCSVDTANILLLKKWPNIYIAVIRTKEETPLLKERKKNCAKIQRKRKKEGFSLSFVI